MRDFIFIAAAAAGFASINSLTQQVPAATTVGAEEQRVLTKFLQNHPDGTTLGKEELIQAVLKLKMLGQTVRERSVLIEGDLASATMRRG